jgi:hypothetical protein
LLPYTRYDETEKNFFYSSNKKAERLLAEIAGEMQSLEPQKKIPENMLCIQSRPDTKKDWEIKSLKEDTLNLSGAIISREMSGEYYKLSYYNDLWLINLTTSKELPILLLKLLECMEQGVYRNFPWASRPYYRLITSSSFAAFVLCRLNCLWYVRVIPQ